MTNDKQKIISEEIRIKGIVQGVGFRPTVYRIAKALGLRGEVFNDGEGVLIRVLGSEKLLTQFVQELQKQCPPLAIINQITRSFTDELNFDDFVISSSINII